MSAKFIITRQRARLILALGILLVSSPAATAEEVRKEYWVDAMRTALPDTFCQSMHFFRQCFDINEDQCIETASLATRICVHQYINQIPDTLNQPKDGAKWSNIIGQCAGENYFSTLSRIYKDTKECNDMNHWK